ncbi:alpha-(1-_3)-arabinofuranosyltransferase domain-containing protein, partial [Catenulispora subtropica]|uniref:alpha-(1->3)-arabinofuranosyltransferase domain-containing protein n=1 Tax=Catenulispora subtropica TaxID=450798 RepID=UPI0031E07C6F
MSVASGTVLSRPGSAATPDPGDRPAGRRWLLAAWLSALVALLAEAPGRMVFDTKLGVDIDPAGFLGRLWHLWNPLESMGRLDDQYVGYAFPMAPFYGLARLIRLPVWITERLWMSLILAAAFWGLVRLAEALGIGAPRGRLVAGVCYALWPTFTILIGSTSAAVLPVALVPWAVLPLVKGSQGGNPVAAAARSALAVLGMGGVNGVITLLALIAPFLFLVTRTPGRRRRVLIIWWIPCVGAAVLWWLAPLLYMGRYGFNFLPYIETARTSTRTMSATAALRGAGNWTAYLHFGSPFLIAGWVMVASWAAILGAAVVSAAGLAGVARGDLPEARWLRSCLAVAALVALAGYAGSFGGPFHGAFQRLLDGPAAPFRNVYKFEPLIGLVLTLGAAHVLAAVETPRVRPWMSLVAALVAAAALCGTALPYLSGRVLESGSFKAVPDYWKQTADFLAANSPRTDALLEPAASHGFYSWGSPIDEPLEPLGRSPWVHRYIAPIGSPGGQRMLDGLEASFASAERIAGLPAYLARAGIRYVVVRSDLDQKQFDYISPVLIHRTLDLSGFVQVAHFGPVLPAAPIQPGTPLGVAATVERFYAVEIYQAADPAARPAQPARLLPVAATVQASGGPESLLQTADSGLIDGRAVRFTGDVTGADPLGAQAPLLVTDGLRRADTTFGLARDNISYTYTATETSPPGRQDGSAGKPPRQILPFSGIDHQSTAVLDGAASVQASTFGSWLLQSPQYDPVNAFDADPGTAWAEGDPSTPDGQWLQITFDHPIDLSAPIGVRLLDDSVLRPIATRLRVTTDQGSVTDDVTATPDSQPLAVPPGRTTRLRVTIDAARGGVPGGFGAGITDLTVPGVHVTRYIQAPHDTTTAGRDLTLSFHRQTIGQTLYSAGDPETGLYRQFTLDAPATFSTSLAAVSAAGPALDAFLDGTTRLGLASSPGLRITTSPALGDLPAFRPENLADGSYLTGWLAGDDHPAVHLAWPDERTLDKMTLISPAGYAAPPLSVHIESPAGTRDAQVGPDGTVTFPALRTDRIDITFPSIANVQLYDPVAGADRNLPLGLSEIYIPALSDLRLAPTDVSMPFQLPCGQGPAITIDGRDYPTSASGTLGDLLYRTPVTVRLCTDNASLKLGAGTHRIAAPGFGGSLAVSDLTLSTTAAGAEPATSTPATGAQPRSVDIASWDAERRTLDVGPGDAAYLEVHENQAKGWTASLDGHRLTPVRLDGWQQGYLIPAGAGGLVTLTYTPATGYRLTLLLGIAVAALLAGFAMLAGGIRRWDGLEPSSAAEPWGPWAVVVGGTVVLAVAAGPVAVALPLLYLAGRRWAWAPPVLAFAAFVAAGTIAAVSAAGPAPSRGSVAPVPGPAAAAVKTVAA